jgi:hypothetical protein
MQQLVLYVAEILFFVLFVATLLEYLRRRDPVSRDVALSFSALAALFIASLWQDLLGGVPEVVRQVAGGLFILQPVFILHLVTHPTGSALAVLGRHSPPRDDRGAAAGLRDRLPILTVGARSGSSGSRSRPPVSCSSKRDTARVRVPRGWRLRRERPASSRPRCSFR